MSDLMVVLGNVGSERIRQVTERLREQGKRPQVVSYTVGEVERFYSAFTNRLTAPGELVHQFFGIEPRAACQFVISLNALPREQRLAVLVSFARALGNGGARKVKGMIELVAA